MMASGVDWNRIRCSSKLPGSAYAWCVAAAGRPLLLITGIGANLDTWAPFARLAGDRELIAFDAPGAGLSQRPRRPLRMQGLSRVVRELLDALGLERVDVLGYSFGGALAQELAWRAPNRVRRLVLCATAPGLGGTPPRPLAAALIPDPPVRVGG